VVKEHPGRNAQFELTAESAALRALVAELTVQVEELKRRLGQSSSTLPRYLPA
jgi:hypothetical protein